MVTDEVKPFFTIIMACHNASRYIEEAIQSVLNQTIDDWELVVCDDASSDGSFEIASRFSLMDTRIKVFRLDTNRGVGYARNRAVEKATGKWLAILDSDDVFYPEKLQRQYEIITRACSELVLVGSAVRQLHTASGNGQKFIYPVESALLKKALRYGGAFPANSSIVIEAKIFRLAGGYNERFLQSEDRDLFFRIARWGEFTSAPEVLVKYTVKPYSEYEKDFGGYPRKVYSVAAHICERLRILGHSDPSADDHSFESLLSRINATYDKSGAKKARIISLRFRQLRLSSDWAGLVRILLFEPRNLVIFLYHRWCSNKLERLVVKAMIDRNKLQS